VVGWDGINECIVLKVQDSNGGNVKDGGGETSGKVVVAKVRKVQDFELIKAIPDRARQLVIIDQKNSCDRGE